MKILSNLPLPVSAPHICRSFPDYMPELDNRRQGGTGFRYVSLSELLPHIPAGELPDTIIISTPEYLPVPEDIAAFRGLKILLITDWNICLRYLEDICPLFDFCFTDCCGADLLKSWSVKNIQAQPLFGPAPKFLGWMEHINTDKSQADRKYDVSFCGNLNSSLHRVRNRALYGLADLSSKFNLYIGQVYGEDYVRVLGESRLVWNHSIRGEANMRTFEAMICGAVPLIEKGNQEVPALFAQGVHYAEYMPENLEEVVSRLLNEPKKLEEMGRAAREAAWGHIKEKQIMTLLGTLSARAGGHLPPDILDSAIEKNAFAKPEKALVKNNFLSGGYDHLELVSAVSPRFINQPELEWEIMPAILLRHLESRLRQGQSGEQLVKALKARYLRPEYLPQSLCGYFETVMHRLSGHHDLCIKSAKSCTGRLDDLIADDARIPDRKALYRYFIHPLGLGDALTVDINLSLMDDRENGGYLGICHLLRDNALLLLALSAVQTGQIQAALEAESRMSERQFLSAPRILVQAKVFPHSGDKGNTLEALRRLDALDPLNCEYWSVIIDGLIRIGDHAALKEFSGKFFRTAETVYHQDKELLSTLRQLRYPQ